MRKITQLAVDAFLAGREFKSGNTSVDWFDGWTLILHGHHIAKRDRDTGNIWVTNAGWGTPTTRERLNALPGVSVCQRKGEQILNGEVWDGEWTEIK